MWGKISPGFRGNSPNTGWAWIVIPNLCASHRISSIVVNQSSTAMWWAKSLGRCWHFAQHSLFVSFSYHTFSHMPCCRWLVSGRFEGISLQDLHFIASRVVVYLAQKIERMNVNGLALFLRADGHKKNFPRRNAFAWLQQSRWIVVRINKTSESEEILLFKPIFAVLHCIDLLQP